MISFGPEALDGALSWISCDIMGVTGGYAARPLRIKSRSCGLLCGQKLSVEECRRWGGGLNRVNADVAPFKSISLKSRHLSSRFRDRTSVVFEEDQSASLSSG